MNNPATSHSTSSDPLVVLGLPSSATESDVRRRYLELVRKYPPEREPQRFQAIHAAYQAASDPLIVAERLVLSDTPDSRPWSEIIEEHRRQPPRLPLDVLLGLGNVAIATGSLDSADDQASEQGQ